jgi:hypothetical protein
MDQKKNTQTLAQTTTVAMTQKQPQALIWTLNLAGYSKIATQYYCELHSKRPQALLGQTDFRLPYEMSPEGILSVRKEVFRDLEALVQKRIIENPTYVDHIISSRGRKLELVKKNLAKQNKLLESGKFTDCDPLKTFEHLTGFACYYLEHNFPTSLFKNLAVEKLKYSEEDFENFRLQLLTPCESAYLTHYKATLELALQKKTKTEVDFHTYRMQYSSICDRELRWRSDEELNKAIQRIARVFGSTSSLHSEIKATSTVESRVRTEHAKIKQELRSRCWREGMRQIETHLVEKLADLLMEAALENEQTSIWRGRTFAYLSYLIKELDMNPHTASIREIQANLRRLH